MTVGADPSVQWAGAVGDAVVGGRRLRYLDTGSGPAALLIHGLGGSWQTWWENIPALSRSHRVLAVDLPGFGRSDALPAGRGADEYVEVLAELLGLLGIESAVVVGHSMGGMVATMFAEQRPDRCRGLVLVSGGSTVISPTRLAVMTVGFGAFDAVVGRTSLLDLVSRHAALRWLFLRGAVVRPESLSPALAREVVPAMRAPGFAAAVTSTMAVVRRRAPIQATCPVALIWGRNDHLVPLSTAHRIREALPDARLAVLDDVGHCAMFEWPDAFNEALLDFLDELDRGPGAATSRRDQGRSVAWYPRPSHGLRYGVRRLVSLGTGWLGGWFGWSPVRPVDREPHSHVGAQDREIA